MLPLLHAGPSSAGFDPLSISGLKGWFIATTELLQTVAGSPATADGDRVGEWGDQSGGNNDLFQATAGKRGTLKLNIQNGLPVVRFDGIDDHLASSAVDPPGLSQPTTLFAVAKTTTTATAQKLFDGETDRQVMGYTATAQFEFYAGTGGMRGTADTSFHVLCYRYNAGSGFFRLDGTQQGATFNAGDNMALDRFIVGIAADVTSQPFSGDVGEILVYDAALSAAQIQQVEGYLRSKWGTP